METNSQKSSEVQNSQANESANLVSKFVFLLFAGCICVIIRLLLNDIVFDSFSAIVYLPSVCNHFIQLKWSQSPPSAQIGTKKLSRSESLGLNRRNCFGFRANLCPFSPTENPSAFSPMFSLFSTANEKLSRNFKTVKF